MDSGLSLSWDRCHSWAMRLTWLWDFIRAIARNNLKRRSRKSTRTHDDEVNESGECGKPGRSRKLELNNTLFIYPRGKLLPVRRLYLARMHHPQSSKAMLNHFVKQFPRSHPGPTYSNSYGKPEENGTRQKYAWAHHITTQCIDTTGTPCGITIRL